jgi:cell wall assembly regulator SMI1
MITLKDDVYRLLKEVPKPPDYELPRGATRENIRTFEEVTGLCVPAPLVELLLYTNGPVVGPGGIFGIAAARTDLDIETVLRQFPSWKSLGWIPVAGDGAGNYYVITVLPNKGKDHVVLFVDTHDNPEEAAYIVASNLWNFLHFLLSAETGERGWPFEPQKVLSEDPDLSAHDNFPMPWT